MAKEILLLRVLNGQSGDPNICNMFTEYFQSVYRPNTSGADLQYERHVQSWLAQKSDGSKRVTSIDIDVVQRYVDKLKSKKQLVTKALWSSISSWVAHS